MCLMDKKDEVGAPPTGDAPTTSGWSTILLATKVRLVLQVWRYSVFPPPVHGSLQADATTGLILGLCPTNERQRYFVTASLIGWVHV